MNFKRTVIAAAVFLTVAFVLITSFHISTEQYAHYSPTYEKTDIAELLAEVDFETLLEGDSDYLTSRQYEELYQQTGLGKPGADAVIQLAATEERKDVSRRVIEKFKSFQEDFFADIRVNCERIGIITCEEHVTDADGDNEKLYRLAPIEEGDVLITKNTHSLGWRHGHSGIVIDERGEKTLEAVLWGEDSSVQSMEKWRTYPSFILLRPKESPTKDEAGRGGEFRGGKDASDRIGLNGAEAAAYVRENLAGVPYGLLTGIPFKAPEEVKKTQCAHIIWYPYFKQGADIDSDGGWLVTPNDLVKSDFFDIVQVYGVDPTNPWN